MTALDAGTDEAAAQTGPEFFGDESGNPWEEAQALAVDLDLDACGPTDG